MKKLLVVVDMQNDFIVGALGSEQAKGIVPAVTKKIASWDGDVICTVYTHDEDYLSTFEGKKLPIVHCVENTEGWKVFPKINSVLKKSENNVKFLKKPTFGSIKLANHIKTNAYDYVEFVGLCSDICVIANVLLSKTINPETEIVVDAQCVAGSTNEKNKSALEVMKSCLVTVINE